MCTCSLGGQTVEIRSDSPAIVEPGDRLLVAGKVRAGLLASLVAANLEHGVTYERANPRRLTALGAGFVLVACVACVTTVSDARWAPEAPLWWTLFPLAVASLLSLGLLGAGAYLLHLARAIRRAAALVSDTELRARVATDGAVGGCRGGRRTLPHV